MLSAWIKGFLIGAALTLVFIHPWLLAVLGCAILLFLFMDWSGQGDGREGCNRHTSCNH